MCRHRAHVESGLRAALPCSIDRNQLAPAGAAALALMALAACSTPPAGEPRTEAVEVPPRWAAARAAAGKPAGAQWWTAFGEARLNALVVRAIAANHDLAAAAARVEQARAQARIAGAVLHPNVDASVTASRARQNFVGLPLPGAGVASSISTTYGISLNASWELDLWGRLRAGRTAAIADLKAVEAERSAAALSIAGQTARIYFAIAEAREQLALAQATLLNRRTTASRVRRRYEAGLRPPFDLRLALANEAAATALAAQRGREIDALQRQLELLLGDYPRATVAVSDALPRLGALPDAGVPAELLSRRPDVLAAERTLAASGGRVAAARAALCPQLRLSASAGRRGTEPAQLADSALSVWSLAADLLAPVFQGGRLRADIELSEARRSEALERYRQTLLLAFTEVETALAADRLLETQVKAARERVEHTRGAQRLAEDRYGAGLVTFLEVLEAQRQALDAASQLLAARRQRIDARVDLYLALGGGLEPSADVSALGSVGRKQ